MRLCDLLKGVEIEKANVDMSTYIKTVFSDSRKVEAGSAFVAIRGYKIDGHSFIKDALSNGAVAVILEEDFCDENVPYIKVLNTRHAYAVMNANFYQNPSKNFKLIGVTGTNGKTSTTYILKAILETAGMKVGLIGTNQNMIGPDVIETERTTPESDELQALFFKMYEEKADCVVMEVSSHSLYLNRVDASFFDVGVFTNLTQDHLDFHETMENYVRAKARLFKMCTAGIINADDPYYNKITEGSTSMNFTFSIDSNNADFMAKNVRLKADGVDFELLSDDGISRMEMKIPGKFSVYNALGAIGAARVLGVSIDDIIKGLKEIKGVKGRAEVVPTNTPYTVIIDYAHTPDGILNILNTVRGFAKAKIILLFGCGGDRDRTKRPKMGKIAAELADYCIVTSDNPRTEDPLAIIDDILEGMRDAKCEYAVIPNRKKAIAHALKMAKEDDIIILAGKGHETYQILKDETIHFDEREIINELFKND